MMDTLKATCAVIAVMAVLVLIGQACAHMNKAAPTLSITAEACEKIAVEWKAPDVAEYCRKGGDLAPVLEILLAERAKTRKAAEEKAKTE